MPKQSSKCPGCDGLIAITARTHCPAFTCGWVNCQCGATFDTLSGRFYTVKARGSA